MCAVSRRHMCSVANRFGVATDGKSGRSEWKENEGVCDSWGFGLKDESSGLRPGMHLRSFCKTVWKLLNHDQGAKKNKKKLWKPGWIWQQKTSSLIWFRMSQKQRFKGTSLFYLHTLPEDEKPALKAGTFEPPLIQCVFLPKPSPGHEAQRTLWKVQMLFGAATHPEKFPGPHLSQDAIRQGAQRSIVTQRPRFRGLLRGTAVGNTERHCCKRPGASSNMIQQ